MTSPIDDSADEFVAVARQAMRSGGGAAAIDALDWWDLLSQLDDRATRFAVFALLRAQGHELASSPALGALLAQPYLDALGAAPGSVVVAVLSASRRRDTSAIVFDDTSGRSVLVDRPGHGLTLFDGDEIRLDRLDVPGRLVISRIDLDSPATKVDINDVDAVRARRRSAGLGRIALAAEILGAAEGAVDLAVDYAKTREQFGEPIGRFQAVRHLLALARTDCVALAAVLRQALWLDDEAPERYDEIVKALAGRNGRRACERSLQVLGGIGFTAEHDHHHHHSRVLLLDGLLGSSAELTHDLGSWLREGGSAPRITTAAMAAGTW